MAQVMALFSPDFPGFNGPSYCINKLNSIPYIHRNVATSIPAIPLFMDGSRRTIYFQWSPGNEPAK